MVFVLIISIKVPKHKPQEIRQHRDDLKQSQKDVLARHICIESQS